MAKICTFLRHNFEVLCLTCLFLKVNTTDSEVQAVGHHDDDNEDLEKILAQIFDEVQQTRGEPALCSAFNYVTCHCCNYIIY